MSDCDTAARAGLNFIEPQLAPLGLEDDATFAKAKADVVRSALPTEAFGVLFPRDMVVVGPSVEKTRVRRYLARAAELSTRSPSTG